MRTPTILILLFVILLQLFMACTSVKQTNNMQVYSYKPDDQKLHDTIVSLDSILFNAYNNCNVQLDLYASFFSDSLEFFHDKGGLMTSKQDFVEATKRNICGKVTRELVKGSIEVYPIHGYGAVEMGLHRFHNNTEKEGTPSRAGKFIIIWQHKNNQWLATKVVSLH